MARCRGRRRERDCSVKCKACERVLRHKKTPTSLRMVTSCDDTHTVPEYFKFRIRLSSPKALSLPSSAYSGAFSVGQVRALPLAGEWMRRKTRGLLVFYFTSAEAVAESRMIKKRERACQRTGDPPPTRLPGHVYVPIEPGGSLWMTVPVPHGSTPEQAVSDALWRPISEEAKEILQWYASFLDDVDLPLNFTTAEPTRRFVEDYNARSLTKAPLGNLIDYTGDLQNDGTTHPLRRPEHPFPCLV